MIQLGISLSAAVHVCKRIEFQTPKNEAEMARVMHLPKF